MSEILNPFSEPAIDVNAALTSLKVMDFVEDRMEYVEDVTALRLLQEETSVALQAEDYENIQLFQVQEQDIEAVLFANRKDLLYGSDVSLRQIAHEVFPQIDLQGVWDAYNSGTTPEEAKNGVDKELVEQLRIFEVLKPATTGTLHVRK